MESVDSANIPQQFQRILREVREHGTPTVIESDGEPVAAIVSIDDWMYIQRNKAFKVFDEIGQLYNDEPLAKIETEVAKAVRETREERRRKSIATLPEQ